MTAPEPPHLVAMMAAADREWQSHADRDWTLIDFRRWPRGFHRSAWVIAGSIGWNPLDVLDRPPPAARAINVLLTRQCLVLAIAMTKHVPDPGDPDEPLLAWFNATREEHQHGIVATFEAFGTAAWSLPASHKAAARKLVSMWDKGGPGAFAGLQPTQPIMAAGDTAVGTGPTASYLDGAPRPSPTPSPPDPERAAMPGTDSVNWQPISQMPLVASMIDGALGDTREHLQTLTEARSRPHVLDNAIIDRSTGVHTEQMQFVGICAQQISRWRTAKPSPAQRRELDRMDAQNQQLRAVTTDVLALTAELRAGTIDRMMGMTDLELGLQAMLGHLQPGRR